MKKSVEDLIKLHKEEKEKQNSLIEEQIKEICLFGVMHGIQKQVTSEDVDVVFLENEWKNMRGELANYLIENGVSMDFFTKRCVKSMLKDIDFED